MSGENSQLPDSWVRARLADIVQPTRPKHSPQEFSDLQFIGMENVEAHTMRLLGTVSASSMRSNAVHFQAGDVLYGRLRPYLNKVYCPDFEGLCSAEFIVFPANDWVESKFLQYFLNSSSFVSFASHLNAGDRPRVDFDQIGEYQVPLAPPHEQKRIVGELEKQFTRLDAAVAALKRVQANLKRYRTAVLKAACEGRLVSTEAELASRKGRSYEPASELLNRILAERRALSRAIFGETDPGEKEPSETTAVQIQASRHLPEGWKLVTIEQVAETTDYGTSAKTEEDNCGVPVLRMGNITSDGRLDLQKLKYLPPGHGEFPRLLLKKGDLLFNRTNSAELVGKCAVYEGEPSACSFASYLIRARLTAACDSRYLAACLNSDLGRGWIKTVVSQQVGQANVNGTKLKAFPFPLPPFREQQRIVAAIESAFSQADRLELLAATNVTRAERLRQAILKHAFEGKLIPQDPDDEPASVLLERIRAKRLESSMSRKSAYREEISSG
jgi:type I restriction enzyme S subunit